MKRVAAVAMFLILGCGTEEDAAQEQAEEAEPCVVKDGCVEECEPCDYPGIDPDSCTMCHNVQHYTECPQEKRQSNGCFDVILLECLTSFPENC